MDILLTNEELGVLYGLPHIQQLTYLRGIRPYMDIKTGLAGIKRRISHQSISEQLYVEPHQGIKSQSFSRDQVRRAISGLVRAGVIDIQSDGMQLILKCSLATRAFSVQNKAAINPPYQAAIDCSRQSIENNEFFDGSSNKAVIDEPQKAATPLNINNIYIYLLQRFEHFWRMYPEKKSRERAFDVFKQINPDDALLKTMLQALEQQIQARNAKLARGEWVPAWKFAPNWLAQKCWEDEVKIEIKEKNHEKRRRNTQCRERDPFWDPETQGEQNFGDEDEHPQSNVIDLKRFKP